MEMQQDRCEFYVELNKILKVSPSETFNIAILARFGNQEFHFVANCSMLIFEKETIQTWGTVCTCWLVTSSSAYFTQTL